MSPVVTMGANEAGIDSGPLQGDCGPTNCFSSIFKPELRATAFVHRLKFICARKVCESAVR